MILLVILFLLNVYIYIHTTEPENLRIVKERYELLREHIRETDNDEFAHLVDPIGLCIDGEPNEIMHVLIHELAHTCVEEYAHSPAFWDKYDKPKTMSIAIGIYQEIPEKTEFCGKHIQDK